MFASGFPPLMRPAYDICRDSDSKVRRRVVLVTLTSALRLRELGGPPFKSNHDGCAEAREDGAWISHNSQSCSHHPGRLGMVSFQPGQFGMTVGNSSGDTQSD